MCVNHGTFCTFYFACCDWLARSGREQEEAARVITAVLARVAVVVGGFLMGEVVLGLFVQSGAVAPWVAIVTLDGAALIAGGCAAAGSRAAP